MRNEKVMMQSVAAILLATLALLTQGCAGKKPGEPIIDTKGVDMVLYQNDLEECSEYADEVGVGQQAAVGAVSGAVVGAAVGAIWDGYRGQSVERGAATGAVLGGAGGTASGVTERHRVVKNCLRNRGYAVLN